MPYNLNRQLIIDLTNWRILIGGSQLYLSFSQSNSKKFTLAFIALVATNQTKTKNDNGTNLNEINDNAEILRKHLNPKLQKMENLYTIWKQRLNLRCYAGRQFVVQSKANPNFRFFDVSSYLKSLEYRDELFNTLKECIDEKEIHEIEELLYQHKSWASVLEIAQKMDDIFRKIFLSDYEYIDKLFSVTTSSSVKNPVFKINVPSQCIKTIGLSNLLKKASGKMEITDNQKFQFVQIDDHLHVLQKKLNKSIQLIGTAFTLHASVKRQIIHKGILKMLYFDLREKQCDSGVQTSKGVLKELQMTGFSMATEKYFNSLPLLIDSNKKTDIILWFATDAHIANDLSALRSGFISDLIYCYISLESHRNEKFDYSFYLKPVITKNLIRFAH